MMIYELLFSRAKRGEEKFKLGKLVGRGSGWECSSRLLRSRISPGDRLWLTLKIHRNLLETTGSRRECHERRTFNHFSFNKLSRSAVSLFAHIFIAWKFSSARKSSSSPKALVYPSWIFKKHARFEWFPRANCSRHPRRGNFNFAISSINYHICLDLVNKSIRSLTYFYSQNDSSRSFLLRTWNSRPKIKTFPPSTGIAERVKVCFFIPPGHNYIIVLTSEQQKISCEAKTFLFAFLGSLRFALF